MSERTHESIEAQVQALAARWAKIYDQEQTRFANVGMEAQWGAATPEQYLEHYRAEFAQALEDMQEQRTWRNFERSPDYAQRLHDDWATSQAIDRVTSPEYLGAQAEQHFYASQDPDSEWYRNDLYQGEPGPAMAPGAVEGERAAWQEIVAEYEHAQEQDDALDTQLTAALQRLQDRLEALTQREQTQHHDREEGMSY
jgi:hypothetical protein